MVIEWSIIKKRGNFRPILTYSIKWEDWEQELNVRTTTVLGIPVSPENRSQRLTSDSRDYSLPEPDYRGVSSAPTTQNDYFLIWRPGAKPEYPEVEDTFRRLQEAHEIAVKEAYDSSPFEYKGVIETSEKIKKHVAPGVAAARMLKAVNNE